MDCLYQGYRIEPFEAGRNLWHARIRRAIVPAVQRLWPETRGWLGTELEASPQE